MQKYLREIKVFQKDARKINHSHRLTLGNCRTVLFPTSGSPTFSHKVGQIYKKKEPKMKGVGFFLVSVP